MDESFSELYLRNLANVKRFVRSRVSNPEDVEDLVQTAFYKAYRGYRSFQGKASFSTWITRIAINECATFRLQRMRQRQKEDAYTVFLEGERRHASPDDELLLAERKRLVRRAIDVLSPHFRTAIQKHYLQDVSYRQLAQELGVPLNTAKVWLHRGRKLLKQQLTEPN